MSTLLPFIIAGLTAGSVYGLAGVGLVLTYKTSGIFNFAHGALGTASAFLFYTLHVSHHLPWVPAAAICILVLAPILALALELLTRSIAFAPLTVRVVATVGVLLVIQATIALTYGTAQSRTVPQFLPSGSFTISGTPVGWSDVIIVLVGVAGTAGLYSYFKVARTGIAMRAVVADPDLLDLSGTPPRRVRRRAWVIGVCFASLSGVMLAPLITLDATTFTLLVVQAFGAAAIGRFTSLPLTYIGGLAIGVAASICTKYFTSGLWAGLPSALPFVVLFIVLLLSRKGTGELGSGRSSSRSNWRAPAPMQIAFAVGAVIIYGLAPQFAGYHLNDFTGALANIIVFLSLGLLVKTSGQVSLAHVGFMAIGACAFSHMAVDHGVPWLLALLIAGAVAVPVGAVLAIPAIRLSGLYLALATLGFGIVLNYMFYGESYMFGTGGIGLTEPRPSLLGIDFQDDTNYYYLVLILTAVIAAAVVLVIRGRAGRLLRALSDSPVGLATSGASVSVTRVVVFCLSAFIAAIGGTLAAVGQGNATPDSYPPLQSLVLFTLVIISAGGVPWYAVLAASGLSLVPSYFPSQDTSLVLTLLFGVFGIVFALTPEDRRGLHPAAAAFIDRALRQPFASRQQTSPAGLRQTRPIPDTATAGSATTRSVELHVSNLHVRFGGAIAVNDVSLTVSSGTVVGLIGPNGAGKTTTFNAISGLGRPQRGTVTFDGSTQTRQGPAARARRGLGRTFQRMELFDTLTVGQNVAIGHEAGSATWNPLRHIFSSPVEKRAGAAAVADALSLCGLSELAERVVGTLSTGQRRLVELARCLARDVHVILLDEPSSGLDRAETARFADIIRRVVADRGLGVLLVEHDMSLVSAVCDLVYVMDFGEVIFTGSCTDLVASPLVQAAYLGDRAVQTLANPAASTPVPAASTPVEKVGS